MIQVTDKVLNWVYCKVCEDNVSTDGPHYKEDGLWYDCISCDRERTLWCVSFESFEDEIMARIALYSTNKEHDWSRHWDDCLKHAEYSMLFCKDKVMIRSGSMFGKTLEFGLIDMNEDFELVLRSRAKSARK